MKNIGMAIALSMTLCGLCGCGSFVGGAATGAGATGAGYEVKARKEMDKLDEDLKEGRITQEEYDIRRDQIKRGSVIY
jgi:hypothetical protein